MSPHVFTDRDIHLALDGELPEDDRAGFERWLAENPEMKARHDRYAADREALRAAFAPVAAEPVPARLSAVLGTGSGPGLARGLVPRLAAAVLLFAAGGVVGYLLANGLGPGGMAPNRQVADNALAAHVVYAAEKLHVVEVGADQKDHLVGWLSKRVGTKLVAPDLSAQGYELVGGRLLPAERGVAAQFMYQDHTGNRVSLYVAHGAVEEAETGFRLYEEGGARAFYWLDGGFGYAVAGSVEEDALLSLANAAYRQLLTAASG